MSTLSSSSTDAEAFAAYDDNASYEEDSSRTKALAFITACRMLKRRLPIDAMRGEQRVTRESLNSDMAEARAWLEANPASSGETGHRTRYFACENFQG